MARKKSAPPTVPIEEIEPEFTLEELEPIQKLIADTWQEALSLWSKYIKLSEPVMCLNKKMETEHGLGDVFAMILLDSHQVVLSLGGIKKLNLEGHIKEILAHEIGHHVYCPGDLTDHGRTISRVRRVLYGHESAANFIANLYTDLLINTKIQRDFSLSEYNIDLFHIPESEDAHNKKLKIVSNFQSEFLQGDKHRVLVLETSGAWTLAFFDTKSEYKEVSLNSNPEIIQELQTNALNNRKLTELLLPITGHKRLDIPGIYQKIATTNPDDLWKFYMRTYEILFMLPKGTLTNKDLDPKIEGDARLASRLVQNYSKDWIHGSGRFAAICYPYLLDNQCKKTMQSFGYWNDTKSPGSTGDIPEGLIEVDADEMSDCVHPALEEDKDGVGSGKKKLELEEPAPQSMGQCREPFELGQILKDMGLSFKQEDLTIQYYKERAKKYLIPFPVIKQPVSTDPIAEGLDVWDIGSPLENINWIESISRSPIVIPGYTTVETHYGVNPGNTPSVEPVDLDIYIDCSGSMPDPSNNISYLALAGTIICLSALRVGSKVQATLWSGPRQFHTTNGFIRDEKEILRIVTGYIGGSTAFPIHILRETYSKRKPGSRKVHILQISDDGITTMFDKDEKKGSGWDISRMALENAKGGGTFVLNLYSPIESDKSLMKAQKMGWDIHVVRLWEDLVIFAKNFSKKHYEK